MFGMPGASPELVSMRAGKANLEGTTVTSDPRKGLLIMRKSDDGLTHLIWKDRVANSVVDDLIVFEGDAKIQRVEECKDGFCMLIAFAAGGRKLFFYSQEPRKKGSDWEDVSKEKDLMDKFHRVLTGESATAREGTGALGMTQAELLAMLGGTVAPPAPAAPAAPASSAAPAAAAGAAPVFSADSISSILGSIPAPPAGGAAPAFSADAISSILGGLGPAAGPPVALNDVLRAEDVVPKVDEAMEAALAEHLPSGDSAAATLSTPQMAQAAMRFNEALYQGDAFGLMRELNLNPTGPGLEPFLRALQASTDAAKAKEEEEEPVDKMDES
eukprot:jgi/Chrpa1/14236/Chrysochromulina_OHIO_Genome00018237-RA